MARPAPALATGRQSGPRPTSKEVGSAHLTGAIARGDQDAFAAFYEIWFDRAFAMARKLFAYEMQIAWLRGGFKKTVRRS